MTRACLICTAMPGSGAQDGYADDYYQQSPANDPPGAFGAAPCSAAGAGSVSRVSAGRRAGCGSGWGRGTATSGSAWPWISLAAEIKRLSERLSCRTCPMAYQQCIRKSSKFIKIAMPVLLSVVASRCRLGSSSRLKGSGTYLAFGFLAPFSG